MIVLLIMEQLPEGGAKELIIVDAFFDSAAISEKLKRITWLNANVEYFSTYSLAYKYASRAKFDFLFIDSDVGIVKFFKLFYFKIKNLTSPIFVYEEGVGTYRRDLYVGIKKSILPLFGVGVYFGGSIFTKGIFVLDEEEYKEKFPKFRGDIVKIKRNIADLIATRADDLYYIFELSGLNLSDRYGSAREQCLVYLTDWDVNFRVLKMIRAFNGAAILKLHPHIKSFNKDYFFDFFIIKNSVPAEMVIMLAVNYFNRVFVIHHGSSVERYVKYANVSFVHANAVMETSDFKNLGE